MLGKLLKHEFKATGRLLLPIYIAFIIITPITAVYLRLNGTSLFPEDSMFFNVLSGLCMALYIIANIAMVTASYIVILYMFYNLQFLLLMELIYELYYFRILRLFQKHHYQLTF